MKKIGTVTGLIASLTLVAVSVILGFFGHLPQQFTPSLAISFAAGMASTIAFAFWSTVE